MVPKGLLGTPSSSQAGFHGILIYVLFVYEWVYLRVFLKKDILLVSPAKKRTTLHNSTAKRQHWLLRLYRAEVERESYSQDTWPIKEMKAHGTQNSKGFFYLVSF